MAYASIQDIAVSWDHYQRFLTSAVQPPPGGLIMYVAGPTDDGVRLIAVWGDEQSSERFRLDRLAPAAAEISWPIQAVWTVRNLKLAHVVVGAISQIALLKEQHPC